MSVNEARIEVLDILEQLQDQAWMLRELRTLMAELPESAPLMTALAQAVDSVQAVAALVEERAN